MRLRVLGCDGGIGQGGRTTTLQVDDDILIDAGSGMLDLDSASLHAIRHVFVTHSHLDHVLGLPLLLDAVFGQIDEPITVHGRPETLDALGEHVFNNAIWPDFRELSDAWRASYLHFAPMEPGELRQVGARALEMAAVEHAIPAAGYIVAERDGGRFAFSGDTGCNTTFWDAINRNAPLDLLIVETAFPNAYNELAQAAGHYVPATLIGDLAALTHEPQVAITHLKPGCEREIMDELAALAPQRAFHRLQAGDSFRL